MWWAGSVLHPLQQAILSTPSTEAVSTASAALLALFSSFLPLHSLLFNNHPFLHSLPPTVLLPLFSVECYPLTLFVLPLLHTCQAGEQHEIAHYITDSLCLRRPGCMVAAPFRAQKPRQALGDLLSSTVLNGWFGCELFRVANELKAVETRPFHALRKKF